jgi:1,4-alpha-glucan branching enzyme
LPLSHDEVVHGKGSLLTKMPGDEWQKFANLRLMYSYMYMHPGTKLLFMGAEIAQHQEWNHEASLDWHLLENHMHKGVQSVLKKLNAIYKKEKALYEQQFSHLGFEFIDMSDNTNCVISFMRKSENEKLIVVCNFSAVVHDSYRIGVPDVGSYSEIFNSDLTEFGGSGIHNKKVKSESIALHGKENSIKIVLPPLACLVMKVG